MIGRETNTWIHFQYETKKGQKIKQYAILEGLLTENEIRQILASCEEGNRFIPKQVGLDEHRFVYFDEETDHSWYTIGEKDFSKTDLQPNTKFSIRELYQRFLNMKGKWDEEKRLNELRHDYR